MCGGGEDSNDYRDHSCDGSEDSNVSTLSNVSAPRVPYYIDADDNVYYMLDRPVPAAPDSLLETRAVLGVGRGKAVLANRNSMHFHLADQQGCTFGATDAVADSSDEISSVDSDRHSQGRRNNSYDATYSCISTSEPLQSYRYGDVGAAVEKEQRQSSLMESDGVVQDHTGFSTGGGLGAFSYR